MDLELIQAVITIAGMVGSITDDWSPDEKPR